METVTSTDGTRIAYWRSGKGPPLLLVHGATADHTTTWRLVLPELAPLSSKLAQEMAEARVLKDTVDRRRRGSRREGCWRARSDAEA